MQKHGLTPDQKLRKAVYDPLPECEPDERAVSVVGSDFALNESSDIKRLLKRYGYTVRELPTCDTWQDLLDMSKGKVFLDIYPAGKYGMETQARRLNREHLYLPGSFDYEEIKEEIRTFAEAVKNSVSNVEKNDKGAILRNTENSMSFEDLEAFFQQEIVLCEDALKHAKSIIGRTPIALDYLYHPRPLGLAKLLLTHDFNVTTIYLDSISAEEKEAFDWLKVNCPNLELRATIHPKMRVLPRENEGKILAIGQKAAWFTGSRHFVNMVQGGGLWGFDGIRRTAELMTEAFLEEKDTEDLVVRKGWGCESCI